MQPKASQSSLMRVAESPSRRESSGVYYAAAKSGRKQFRRSFRRSLKARTRDLAWRRLREFLQVIRSPAESIRRKRIVHGAVAIPSWEQFGKLLAAIRESDGRPDSQAKARDGGEVFGPARMIRFELVAPQADGLSSGVMAGEASRPASPAVPRLSPGFPPTHWSVVLTAGHDSAPGAREALELLCRAYWYPLYCYVRRQVGSAADAEDLTQSFFTHLLERNTLAKVSREKGRFRSFLLAALRYFLADERDKVRAQKRGGGCVAVSWNEAGAEERYQRECGNELTAEQIYERRWAMAVLDRASVRLREEFAAAGRATLGEELRGLQENAADAGPYVEVAARLGMPVNTLKSHVHRYRQRFRELLCEEVAQTVATPADVADELRRLIAVVSGQT